MFSLFLSQENKIAVVVGSVTDDKRLYVVPKLRICALRFTETARARIIKVIQEITYMIGGRRLCPHPLADLRSSELHPLDTLFSFVSRLEASA